MTTIRISITHEVLETTKWCRTEAQENCAIAYVIRKIWPKAVVMSDFIIVPFASADYNLFMKHGQNQFLGKFDHATPAERAAMQPFSFEIEVPDEVIGEVNIEGIRRICEGSKTLELVN